MVSLFSSFSTSHMSTKRTPELSFWPKEPLQKSTRPNAITSLLTSTMGLTLVFSSQTPSGTRRDSKVSTKSTQKQVWETPITSTVSSSTMARKSTPTFRRDTLGKSCTSTIHCSRKTILLSTLATCSTNLCPGRTISIEVFQRRNQPARGRTWSLKERYLEMTRER